MRFSWKWSLLVLGFAVWGCGPPEVVEVVLPGTKPEIVIPEGEQAEALGEQAAMGAVQPPTPPLGNELKPAVPTNPGQTVTTESKLTYETIKPGSGPEIKSGQLAKVHYVGTLLDGKKFDSSRDRGEPYEFRVGVSQVIQGWHQGVVGMKVGEVRKLTIPPDLAYGPQGQPPVIPPNATLVFEIELLGVE